MTSEERASNWISCNIDNKDEVYREGILYTLKRLLDHHAAEARVDQAEKCADAVINNTDILYDSSALGSEVRRACRNAVEEKESDKQNT